MNKYHKWLSTVDIRQYNDWYLLDLFNVYKQQTGDPVQVTTGTLAGFSRALKNVFKHVETYHTTKYGKPEPRKRIRITSLDDVKPVKIIYYYYIDDDTIWYSVYSTYGRVIVDSRKKTLAEFKAANKAREENVMCIYIGNKNIVPNYHNIKYICKKNKYEYELSCYKHCTRTETKSKIMDVIFARWHSFYDVGDDMLDVYVANITKKQVNGKTAKEVYQMYCNYAGIIYDDKRARAFGKKLTKKFGCAKVVKHKGQRKFIYKTLNTKKGE